MNWKKTPWKASNVLDWQPKTAVQHIYEFKAAIEKVQIANMIANIR